MLRFSSRGSSGTMSDETRRTSPLLLFPLFLLGAAVGGVKGQTEVKVINRTVSCCEAAIKYDPDCEITFSINDKNFANCIDGTSECQHPCKKIEEGRMTLHECVDVTLSVVCVKGNFIRETTIHYRPLLCSGATTAQGNHGAAVGGVKGQTEVKVINRTVSCCEAAIKYDPDCEITFSINDKNFANCIDGTSECQHPCKKIEEGRMTLHECVDVTLSVVCVKGNFIRETTIHYRPLLCSGAATAQGNHESVRWLMLLLLLLLRLGDAAG